MKSDAVITLKLTVRDAEILVQLLNSEADESYWNDYEHDTFRWIRERLEQKLKREEV